MMITNLAQAPLPLEKNQAVAAVIAGQARASDQSPPPPRSRRTFHANNYWYFETREGSSVGPYHSKQAADLAANEYVEFAKTASERMLNKLLEYIASTSA